MATISDFLNLKVNMKKYIYSTLYVNCTTHKCLNKIFKTPLDKVFFLFATVVIDNSGAPGNTNIFMNFQQKFKLS